MIIAITCDRRAFGPMSSSSKVRPPRPEIFLSELLVDNIRKVGAEPILIPPGGSNELIEWVVEQCAGVIVSGGAFDIDPCLYGQQVQGRIDRIDQQRTQLELNLVQKCIEYNKPLLGICGGMQVMAVAAGGTLIQDIATQIRGSIEHEQPTDPCLGWHDVQLHSKRWMGWYKNSMIKVNSTHHQAVADIGGFVVAGTAPDGVIEAIEHPMLKFCVGVQWHPELLGTSLFTAMVHSIKESQ
jgi:putative glutamine amidotransferase